MPMSTLHVMLLINYHLDITESSVDQTMFKVLQGEPGSCHERSKKFPEMPDSIQIYPEMTENCLRLKGPNLKDPFAHTHTLTSVAASLHAVSKPKVRSSRAMSLSIVLGMPGL